MGRGRPLPVYHQMPLHVWSPHWCPATDRVVRSPAFSAYARRRSLPAPPLTCTPATPPLISSRSHVSIHLQPINTDTHIMPSRTARIVPRGTYFSVYGAAGHLCGHLTDSQLRSLWRRYHIASSAPTRTSHPRPILDFATEVSLCLIRNQQGAKSSIKGQQTDLRMAWACPPGPMAAARALCHFNTEVFGSALNVNPDTI